MNRIVGLMICFFLMLFIWGDAWGATYMLSPEKDTFVHSSAGMADTNYGTETVFVTGCDYGAWLVRSYLGFDLSGIAAGETITGATLHMYHYNGMGYTDTGVHIHYLADDSWGETEITWNTRPDPNVLSPEISYNPAGGWSFPHWLEWDLMADGIWDPASDLTDGALSLLLKESEGGDQGHNFYSREYTDDPGLRPYLEITTAPIPIPSAVWLLGSGLIGLVGFRRKLRKG